MTSKDLNTLTLAEAKEEIERLRSIILRLALIPANDFYKAGDYAAGLVNEAWIEARLK